MAAQPVTPQHVRDVLSSFLFDKEKEAKSTPTKSSDKGGKGPDSNDSASPPEASAVISPEIAVNRRSYPSFLQRINTFSSTTWFAKPVELSPMVCSRYGWENTEFDMLHCTACGANLCGMLPPMDNTKAYGKACEELREKLQKSHEKFCTLAVNPCPEAYLKIGLHDAEELSRDFHIRLNLLKKSAALLPRLDYAQLETWGFAESHAAKYVAEEDLAEDTPTQLITLAFTGWTLSDRSTQIMQCSRCCRHVGLWLFKPARGGGGGASRQPDSSTPGDSGDAGPSPKIRKLEVESEMDPIGNHYTWCPWVALRVPTEDAVTYFSPSPSPSPSTTDTADNGNSSAPADPTATPISISATSPTTPSNTPETPRARRPSGGVGDVGSEVRGHKQPAWVLAVRQVAPGLLSQSRNLVHKVRQSSMAEGLHCIRKVLQSWVSPERDNERSKTLNTSSTSLNTSSTSLSTSVNESSSTPSVNVR